MLLEAIEQIDELRSELEPLKILKKELQELILSISEDKQLNTASLSLDHLVKEIREHLKTIERKNEEIDELKEERQALGHEIVGLQA